MKPQTEAPNAPPSGGWNISRLRRVTTSSHRYIAEVDGLRFIAIFAVMFFHVYYMSLYVQNRVVANDPFSLLIWPVTHGYRGVQLFFVISGFILGLPFANHYLANGPAVRLGRFYVRRLTRLEPPYILTLLLFYAAAFLLHDIHTREPGFLAGLPLRLVYGYGLVTGHPPSLDGPTWSLEIEVQFYLLVPLLANVFKLPTWPRRLILIAAIYGTPALARLTPYGGQTILSFVHYFLIGFLVADIHGTGLGAERLQSWWYDLAGIGCLLELALAPESPAFVSVLPWLLGVIFICALRGGWLTSILRQPLIAVLGGMCYSLYLLHSPIFSFIGHKIISHGMPLTQAYLRLGAVALPAALVAGIGFYILIERPCMNPNWPQLLRKRVSTLAAAVTRANRPTQNAAGQTPRAS